MPLRVVQLEVETQLGSEVGQVVTSSIASTGSSAESLSSVARVAAAISSCPAGLRSPKRSFTSSRPIYVPSVGARTAIVSTHSSATGVDGGGGAGS